MSESYRHYCRLLHNLLLLEDEVEREEIMLEMDQVWLELSEQEVDQLNKTIDDVRKKSFFWKKDDLWSDILIIPGRCVARRHSVPGEWYVLNGMERVTLDKEKRYFIYKYSEFPVKFKELKYEDQIIIAENLMLTKEKETFCQRYERLRDHWRRRTKFYSDVETISNDKYIQMIQKMGKDVLPLIFHDMADGKVGYWFNAIHQITGETPGIQSGIKDVNEMTKLYLDWAKSNGWWDPVKSK